MRKGGQDTDDRRRPVPAVRLDGKEASPSHPFSSPLLVIHSSHRPSRTVPSEPRKNDEVRRGTGERSESDDEERERDE